MIFTRKLRQTANYMWGVHTFETHHSVMRGDVINFTIDGQYGHRGQQRVFRMNCEDTTTIVAAFTVAIKEPFQIIAAYPVSINTFIDGRIRRDEILKMFKHIRKQIQKEFLHSC